MAPVHARAKVIIQFGLVVGPPGLHLFGRSYLAGIHAACLVVDHDHAFLALAAVQLAT